MRIRVTDTLDGLADDLAQIAAKFPVEGRKVVREGLRVGNSLARDFAKKSSGRHGKRYPNAFGAELHGAASSLTGGALISGEYGPDTDAPQGGMSFERGSRNQKPHLDLSRSADVIAPSFAQEVGDMVDRIFW